MASLFLKSYCFLPSYQRTCKAVISSRHIVITSKFCYASTVDEKEVEKFKTAGWWNSNEYDLLHTYNSVRVPFIRDGILSLARSYEKVPEPLKGYHILDVGCGGGILSEPLARLGANVTGLDPGIQNIEIATEHASKDLEINGRLNYVCDSIENLVTPDTKFDAVVVSEVIEHVNDIQTFIHSCVEQVKANGSLFFTTINKTYLSYLLTILMAEYVIGIIPRGTHEWNKFVKPEDLTHMLESRNCRTLSIHGIMYNPLTKKFSWCKNSANCYALHAVKE